ncbi:hypothetical protein AMS68_005121 [Peltaster fructicola]|uniref:Calpain catalytic domain-containing protein n=1 Tax=Peltaster fructicola TaxID=286661 RepID=A0A6H0XXZ5_9PEZI|nr:hypothetical protein AMS68_005121 [Peltaster fructicola]
MPKNRYRYGFAGLDLPLDEPPSSQPFTVRIIQDEPPRPPSPPPEPPKPRSDHFYPAWDKFLAVQTTRAKVASKPGKALQQEKKLIEEEQPQGLRNRENIAYSWEEAAAECREKVAAIVEECKRLNQKYKDALFDLERNAYCLNNLRGDAPDVVAAIGSPPWIKRVEDIFEKPVFFSETANGCDIRQGQVGDCWFIAALVAVSAKRELIERLCVARDEKVGVYGFVFYRDGEWIYEVIDDRLFISVGDDNDLTIVLADGPGEPGIPLRHDKDKLKEQLQKGSEALYFSRCKSDETWVPLIEKAYAKAHGDYATIEGGYASEGIEDLTGGVATSFSPEDVMDKDRFWDEQMSQVNKKYLFGGGGKSAWSKGIVPYHAYTVLEAWSEGDLKLLKVRNPWGEGEYTDGDWSDGSKEWTPEMMRKLNHTFGNDGVFWMSYKDFFKHFSSISRVRLFDKRLQVAQLWTCVDVPWTVDYLDTRFELTVSEKGPIVVVLQQPDDRYFNGLQGRYRFLLHFRLYKEKEFGQKYLMRSLHNSSADWTSQRSVSAEIDDIEPGKYYIIFKVSAARFDNSTPQEMILTCAHDRKDKLLQVGRSYDYAQTKGNLRAMEKRIRKQQRDESYQQSIKNLEENRRYTKLDRERIRQRRQRVVDATNAKRKAAFEKAAAKRREQKLKNASKDSTTTKDSKLTPSTDSTETEAGKDDVEGGSKFESPSTSKQQSNADATASASPSNSESANAVAETEKKSEIDADAAHGAQSISIDAKVEKDEPATDAQDGQTAAKEAEKKLEANAKTSFEEEEKMPELNDRTASKEGEKPEASSASEVVVAKTTDEVKDEAKEGSITDAVKSAVKETSTTEETKDETTGISTTAEAKDDAKETSTTDGSTSKADPVLNALEELHEAVDKVGIVSDEEEAWESPAEELEELDDNDFDWDPKIDGHLNPDSSSVSSEAGKDIDIFDNDPWNALCVLGLRVYSKCVVKLQVRTTHDADEQLLDEEV